MEQRQKDRGKFGAWIRTSVTARMLMVGFLILILLIPLSFVKDLIRERSSRKQGVMNEISEKWGDEVILFGPVLEIPYKTFRQKTVVEESTKKMFTETIEEVSYLYVFPDALDINSRVNPEEKYYGIYKTSVYQSSTSLSGSFSIPDFTEQEIKESNILWERARIVMKMSNQKGVSNQAKITMGSHTYDLKSRYVTEENYGNRPTLQTLESPVLKEKDVPHTANTGFSMTLDIRGSRQMSFIPVGKQTTVAMTSPWQTANFFGKFLPHNDGKIHENGFDAQWKILEINRPFSQQFINQLPDLETYAFGVNFMIPVDDYQKSERTSKYGFMVISLTFLVFFLIQTLSKIHIHPFQYLMIGLALVMFYTLLISISEHSNFFKAYLIAGTSVIVLISTYSLSILKSRMFSLFIMLSLVAIYTFIYIIIQLENYALITGSTGLFVILAIVMFISRKIDWGSENQ